MDLATLLQVIFLGIALSMDAFAVSVTDGLIYENLNKKKIFFIAGVFGLMQAIMPSIGFWIVEIIQIFVNSNNSEFIGKIISDVVSWIAFALLMYLGINMMVSGLKDLKNKDKETKNKSFSIKEVIYFGFATSIDALGTGVALHAGISNSSTIWIHVSIILCCTFIISLLGLFLGKQINKLFKGKYEISTIIGGIILIILGIWIILSHYL